MLPVVPINVALYIHRVSRCGPTRRKIAHPWSSDCLMDDLIGSMGLPEPSPSPEIDASSVRKDSCSTDSDKEGGGTISPSTSLEKNETLDGGCGKPEEALACVTQDRSEACMPILPGTFLMNSPATAL